MGMSPNDEFNDYGSSEVDFVFTLMMNVLYVFVCVIIEQ